MGFAPSRAGWRQAVAGARETNVSMTVRMAVGVCAVGAMLCGAGGALAQTSVLNPTTVEFDPSPDHSAVSADSQPVVHRYELRMYVLGNSLPAVTTDLGKPAPGSDGKIRVNFSTLTSPWPPPDGDYEARVAAVGPSGVGQSDSSNPFSFSFQTGCTYTLSATSGSVGAAGGTVTATLTAGSGCQWTVTGAPTWLTLSASAGVGGATLGFTAAPNATSSSRTASLTVGGKAYTLTQAAGTCGFLLSPGSATVGGNGGNGTLALTTSTGCRWTAVTSASWLTLATTAGTGSATISFTAAKNQTGTTRSATVQAGGRTSTITQAVAVRPSKPKRPKVTVVIE